MMPDPYEALGLPHSATKTQIKMAYRKLALLYHPDRNSQATPQCREAASNKFALISTAYALLSDDEKKRNYDHIYRYGGYDTHQPSLPMNRPTPPPFDFDSSTSNKRPRGIGYTVHNPVAYVISCGKRQSTTIASLTIPPRMNMAGLRFSYSEGTFTKDQGGVQSQVSKTTQFVQGKKYTKVETTTFYPDGRKELLIEGNDYVERRVTNGPKRRQQPQEENVTHSGEQDLPWYQSAWSGLREKLTSCHNPCGTILVQ